MSRQIEISICNLARGSDHPGNTARGRVVQPIATDWFLISRSTGIGVCSAIVFFSALAGRSCPPLSRMTRVSFVLFPPDIREYPYRQDRATLAINSESLALIHDCDSVVTRAVNPSCEFFQVASSSLQRPGTRGNSFNPRRTLTKSCDVSPRREVRTDVRSANYCVSVKRALLADERGFCFPLLIPRGSTTDINQALITAEDREQPRTLWSRRRDARDYVNTDSPFSLFPRCFRDDNCRATRDHHQFHGLSSCQDRAFLRACVSGSLSLFTRVRFKLIDLRADSARRSFHRRCDVVHAIAVSHSCTHVTPPPCNIQRDINIRAKSPEHVRVARNPRRCALAMQWSPFPPFIFPRSGVFLGRGIFAESGHVAIVFRANHRARARNRAT